MNYSEIIKKKEERKAALVEKSKTASVEELRMINEQINDLNEDIMDLKVAQATKEAESRAAQNEADERTAAVTQNENQDAKTENRSQAPEFQAGVGFKAVTESHNVDHSKEIEDREQAGKDLKENRSVISNLDPFVNIRAIMVGNGASIIVPTESSVTINPDFPVVSSLIDRVSHLSLNGGESYQQAYVTGIAAGDYTTEGANYKEANTTFAYADINKTKITAYNEITEELLKLPAAPYANEVFKNIRTSLRMVLTKEILVGQGGTNHLVGIFSNLATAIDPATDLTMSDIDDTTLDEIIFRYGGDEEVEDSAVLILNKLDLLAFSKVRTKNKEKFYNIVSYGNSGTISGIPFIINSACNQLTDSATAADSYCMCYGSLSNYLVTTFSETEIKRSEDYKFREGMIAHKGVIFSGGNVVRHNGFLRIKKGSSSSTGSGTGS